MFSTDYIFRQQENLVDNQKCQAGFRPLCNKTLLPFRKRGQLIFSKAVAIFVYIWIEISFGYLLT